MIPEERHTLPNTSKLTKRNFGIKSLSRTSHVRGRICSFQFYRRSFVPKNLCHDCSLVSETERIEWTWREGCDFTHLYTPKIRVRIVPNVLARCPWLRFPRVCSFTAYFVKLSVQIKTTSVDCYSRPFLIFSRTTATVSSARDVERLAQVVFHIEIPNYSVPVKSYTTP